MIWTLLRSSPASSRAIVLLRRDGKTPKRRLEREMSEIAWLCVEVRPKESRARTGRYSKISRRISGGRELRLVISAN